MLAYELSRRGFRVVRQQPIPVVYEDIRIDTGFRADLIVEDKMIIEVKSVETLAPAHKKQLRCQWTRRRSSRKVARPPRHAAVTLAPGFHGQESLAIVRCYSGHPSSIQVLNIAIWVFVRGG
ncbi:MAG TPA: GxxExxY protein [Bryobacteraceae bacterium]|nr:GxxExxY protein [Bryobacteraceae bacterium]